ncbi:heptaprenyl diphosphate synthase [Nocardia tenerifensis]|uniref:Heptaprenyl diphosphate synthase n=1 Tax=Nocardia tenerifensis TaxID=228006 RepID=A0A318KAY2_9NOCA|nr:polyprenyl synthetase family protein [Nocardia tenerifensis]PXX71701.1 heptaprenyl diphosphate synthase [Nocardia tenerifensis]
MKTTGSESSGGFAAALLSDDTTTAEAVSGALARVEGLISEQLCSAHALLTESATHLARAGGKRFRPIFTVLAGQLGPHPADPNIAISAAALELIHLASLYHDDVMDEAQLRRGVPSANSLWDNKIAILAGDYLFAQASRLGALLGVEALEIIAHTFAELVTGQTRETAGAAPGTDAITHYHRVIHEKTAVLIATAGRFGAMFSGAEAGQIERMGRLGDAVGIAFQIADDILDIASTAEQFGKRPGTDLREGVHTLPVLYALRESGPDADRLRELLAHPLDTDADLAEAIALLVRSPGMKSAKDDLRHYVDRALDELDGLPNLPANRALRRLIHHTVERAS